MQKANLLRGRIISLLFACFLLGSLEVLSWWIFPSEDRMGEILSILKQDSVLFWRQRPNLNVIFQKVTVKTNSLGLRNKKVAPRKAANVYRIVCLGASPTFGWGVNSHDTYPYKLRRLLAEKHGQQRQIEVINAGEIGYTSYQGLLFLKKEILNLSPDLITISYVLNDVDKYRFYRSDGRSDKELSPKNKILVTLENLLDKSNFFRRLKRIIVYNKGMAVKYFGEINDGIYSEARRVSPEDYKMNLEAIIETAVQNNVKIVLVKMPVNLSFPDEIAESLKAKADGHIISALSYARVNEYDEAIRELKEAVEFNPYSSKAFYYLGIYSERKKKIKQAKGYFQRAKEAELFQCGRLGKFYNETMEEVSHEKNIPLVDIVSTFKVFNRENGKYLFLDQIHDSIHPNALGHEIIARAIYVLTNSVLF